MRYLNATFYKAWMDFFLVDSHKREVVKVKHLPVGRPVLHALHATLVNVIVIASVASIAQILH